MPALSQTTVAERLRSTTFVIACRPPLALDGHGRALTNVLGPVLWRKRSFGCQSERGERFAERMMTTVRTARKQGKDVLDFVVRSVSAHDSGEPPPRLLGAAVAA